MPAPKITKTEWDFSPLFTGDTDPAMAAERQRSAEAVERFVAKWRQRKDYLQEPEVLAEALAEYEALGSEGAAAEKEVYYFGMRTSQDQSDPKLKAAENKITDFSLKLGNQLQFFNLKIGQIPAADQPKFLAHKALKPFRHYLERNFAAAKYRLSEAEEKLMALKSYPAYGKWVAMVSEFIDREEREVLGEDGTKKRATWEELMGLMHSQQKPVRDAAAAGANDVLLQNLDVAEHEMNAILLNKKIDDELRGFERPDSSRLLGDDVDSQFVDTLTSAVSGRNQIAQRFYALKAQLMGQDKLEYHERNVEYGAIDKPYDYAESVALLGKVFRALDPQFFSILKDFVQRGQIDVFPRKGKRGGAFCAGNGSKAVPTYVLLNHTDKLRDVETLAHEMGHAINNELIRPVQNALNCDVPMATAEVASTFMEDFVNQELMERADDELKLALMMQKLNGDISSIFRQVACYLFELELHQQFRRQGFLSKEDIGQLFQKQMAAYMGPAVEQSPGSANWWVYWSHIRHPFYVYSYASGLLISKALQGKVKAGSAFMAQVKDFLAAGTVDSPRNLFAKMGIDINDPAFWHQGIDEIEQLLDQTQQLAKRLGKIEA